MDREREQAEATLDATTKAMEKAQADFAAWVAQHGDEIRTALIGALTLYCRAIRAADDRRAAWSRVFERWGHAETNRPSTANVFPNSWPNDMINVLSARDYQ